MKLRNVVVAVAFAAVLVAVLIHSPAPRSPQTVHFIAFTNGVVGAIVPVYAKLTTDDAIAVQQWLATGTNGAVFSISNQQPCAIWLYPIGRIFAGGTNHEAPLLNAPDFSGICLARGQVAEIQVAVFPHRGPWRFTLNYHRDMTDTFGSRLARLPEEVAAIIAHRPVYTHMDTIHSELIDR